MKEPPAFKSLKILIVIYLVLLVFIRPAASVAQDNPSDTKPPPGKARLVVMFDNYDPRQRVFVLAKAPFFINGQLVCRLKDGTYTSFDVDPGTYFLAAEESGKIIKKRTAATELRTAAGETYFFEMEGLYEGLRSIVRVRKMHPVEFENLVERRRTKYTPNCNLATPAKEGAFVNKLLFLRIPFGYSIPAGSYLNWWPQLSNAFVNRYQPLLAGFEVGGRAGAKNHFLSWSYANSKQPANLTLPGAGISERVEVNVNTLYYSYGFALNNANRLLLYPKAGISSLNYIFETRTETGMESEGVIGFGSSFGLHFEYRISRIFSVDASWDHLNGTVAFRGERKKLDQHRLFVGVQVQF